MGVGNLGEELGAGFRRSLRRRRQAYHPAAAKRTIATRMAQGIIHAVADPRALASADVTDRVTR